MTIHETAIVDPSSEIEKDVSIGPYSVIGPNSKIGKGTIVGSHVVIDRDCRLGKNNRIYSHAAIGGDPQDLKYGGEQTSCVIGDNNTVREYVTINRGTAEGGGKTVVGDGNLFMAYSHIAHDCILGNSVILANAATLGGHVEIHDYVVIGGLTGIHQFVRIGAHAIVGALSGVGRDIPPFVTAALTRGQRKGIFGLNRVGLKRRGFSKEKIERIREAVRLVNQIEFTVSKLVEILERDFSDSEEVMYMADFIKKSKRGVKRL